MRDLDHRGGQIDADDRQAARGEVPGAAADIADRPAVDDAAMERVVRELVAVRGA